MSTIETGGPAFPHEYKFGDGTGRWHDGMTLRQYAASLGRFFAWAIRARGLA